MTKQPSNADVYEDLQAEVIMLARSLTSEEATIKVPQSPAWSIRDVVAHVAGVVDDMLSANLAGIGTDAWTEAHLAKRANDSLGEVCDGWESSGPAFRALGDDDPVFAMRAVADLTTHHHDILQALGRRGERDTASVRLALERYGPFFCERADQAGLPAVRVEAGRQIWQSRDGTPGAALAGPAFEILRALSGRRSRAQILAMDWTGDATRYLDVVSPYGLPTDDVIE